MKRTYHLCLSAGNEIMFRDLEDYNRGFNCFAIALLVEAWKQALEAGAKTSGCTVHYVDAGMDTGEIIMQAHVPVMPDDTAQSLHARIQVQEHILYPAAILSAVARL